MKKWYLVIVGLVMVVSLFFLLDRYSVAGQKEVKYNGNDLLVSIDGNTSSTLPTTGNYYLVNYDCQSSDTVVTWDRTTYELKVTNGSKRGGVSCYLDFQSNPKLADMSAGSYVTYSGSNGCPDGHCDGTNANYVSDTDMGYCKDNGYKFYVNGWRLAYSKNKSAYLISAGAPECMCTASDGSTSGDLSCSDYNSSAGAPLHLENLNSSAIKYCNSTYSYDGVCDDTSAWSMNSDDYLNIMNNRLSTCITQTKKCGYTNDLIDNGGYYWYGTAYNSDSSYYVFYWAPNYRRNAYFDSRYNYGVRPVLRLDSNVIVIGGSGTYAEPYELANNTFLIDETAVVDSESGRSITLSMIGYNVNKMCVNLNSSGCSNYADFSDSYSLDLSTAIEGENIIYVYYKDAAGNLIASLHKSITLSSS